MTLKELGEILVKDDYVVYEYYGRINMSLGLSTLGEVIIDLEDAPLLEDELLGDSSLCLYYCGYFILESEDNDTAITADTLEEIESILERG